MVEVFVRGLHNNQPPWGIGMIWRSAEVALGGRQEEVRRSGWEVGDAVTRQEWRWRQGEAEARVIFLLTLLDGCWFSVVFVLQWGPGELLVKGEWRKFGVKVGEARGGRGEVRIPFACGFFGGVLVFAVVFLFGCRGWGRCWSIWRILVLLLSFVCCGAVEDVSCFSWFFREVFLGGL